MKACIPYEVLIAIANKYGTPVYVYSADKINNQYAHLKSHFDTAHTRFFYACKSLSNIHILKQIKNMGSGIDCSSINEVKLAQYVGFLPDEILYTSNSISFEEIEEAVSIGVHINIDSLSNLEKFGKKYGSTYPIGIRLRPNIMAGGNLKIATGHDKSKFGIPITQIASIQLIQEKYALNIATLHIHTGSEIKDVAVFLQSAMVFESILPFFPNVAVLDFGGGFKVPYMPEEKGTDIAMLGKEVNAIVKKLSTQLGRPLSAWFEPGKYMVSEAGYFISKVNVLKEADNIVFAGIDTGLNHLIRPMFYDAYHHIVNLSNPENILVNYAVVGNVCETDTFAWERPIAKITEGDLLVFYNAGAYGYEMSSNYNARFKPAQVMVENGVPTLISRPDTFEDLLKLQMPLP